MCSVVKWWKNNVAKVVARDMTWLEDTKSSVAISTGGDN